MNELAALKKDITDRPVAHMTKHRPDLSVESQWRIGVEPFVVIATSEARGAVFESAEPAMFTIIGASSLDGATAAAAAIGVSARVLRVNPSWSYPESAWVAARPGLWPASPSACAGDTACR
jgi:hypothetical protein